MCACRCGIRVHLKNGEVRYIEGNPEHPLNQGVICAKGASGIMKQYSPARLTQPLRRKAGAERGASEFERSLDAFPVEYGDILAHHVVVAGEAPFAGIAVNDDDLRRACESWGKAHLIQLREGFVEAGGDAKAVARLIVKSASPFAALLAQIARLRGQSPASGDALARATEGIAGLPAAPVRQVLALELRPELDGDTAMSLFPGYLDAVDALARYLDGWTRA